MLAELQLGTDKLPTRQGRGHLAAGTKPGHAQGTGQVSKNGSSGAAGDSASSAGAHEGERGRSHLTALVPARSPSWRMAPLSRPLAGSQSRESAARWPEQPPGTRPGGKNKGSFVPGVRTDP